MWNKMKNKIKWRWAFLGGTVIVLAMEVWAAFDHNPTTEPLTGLIIQYVNPWITYGVIIGASIWAILHFKKWYTVIKK